MLVRAEVDAERATGRSATTRRTHLLHAALREVSGTHVKQAGSLVAPGRLRFDFTHFAPVGPRELRHIENRVNGEILRGARVLQTVMGREEALAYGALAFFGDKYGERVRVVEVPGFSKEFCGGTHVGQTGEIGLFLLTAEQGISAGTRRVEAVAGEAAIARAQGDQGILEELAAGRARGPARAGRRVRAPAGPAEGSRPGDPGPADEARHGGGPLAGRGPLRDRGDPRLDAPTSRGSTARPTPRWWTSSATGTRSARFALVSASIADDGVSVIAAVSPSLAGSVKAPDVMKQLGLRGGGRPDFAQGGGVASGDVDTMRRKAAELLRGLLEGVPHG